MWRKQNRNCMRLGRTVLVLYTGSPMFNLWDKPSIVVNPSTGEVEAVGSEVQGHPLQHSKFKVDSKTTKQTNKQTTPLPRKPEDCPEFETYNPPRKRERTSTPICIGTPTPPLHSLSLNNRKRKLILAQRSYMQQSDYRTLPGLTSQCLGISYYDTG